MNTRQNYVTPQQVPHTSYGVPVVVPARLPQASVPITVPIPHMSYGIPQQAPVEHHHQIVQSVPVQPIQHIQPQQSYGVPQEHHHEVHSVPQQPIQVVRTIFFNLFF